MSKAAEKEHGQEIVAKRVGIFGGSFDPVHEGHIHLAKLARNAADLDEIWFLPCRLSPHKADEPPAAAADRVKWLEAAVRGLPWAKIETLELKLKLPSYSYRTLEILDREYPGNQWFWIMGGDQWAGLDRWKQPEAIAKLASFVVLARNGMTIMERPGFRLKAVLGEHPASSSEIRRAIARSESDIPYLDPEVERLMLSGHF